MHYLTACLIFKDSAPYLDEWIRFHLKVGFDHLYLYDNDCSTGPTDRATQRPESNQWQIPIINQTPAMART